MHIMEGFLPLKHAALWSVLAAPFIGLGTRKLSSLVRAKPEQRLLLGACAGFVFVLSALKLPSVTGSCSHPTGIGLGAILFGPRVMVVIGFVVLLFQAMLLAHGGLTTLGANLFSMAVAGGIVSYCLYRFLIWARAPLRVSVFFAAAMADLLTYVVTSLQLAWAFPDPSSGFEGSAIKFLSLFALTQLPLAVAEGLLTVLVVNLLESHATDISVCAACKPRRETS